MSKRMICLLLALTMIFALAAGCGSSTGGASPAAESKAPASSEQAKAPAATNLPAESSASTANSQWLSDKLVTLTYWQSWPPFLQAISQPSDNPLFAKLQEILNVHLEITVVSTETVSETFNLMVASGDMTDLIQTAVSSYAGGGQKAIEDEILVDLKPLIEQYATNYQAIIDSDENVRKTLVKMRAAFLRYLACINKITIPIRAPGSEATG